MYKPYQNHVTNQSNYKGEQESNHVGIPTPIRIHINLQTHYIKPLTESNPEGFVYI